LLVNRERRGIGPSSATNAKDFATASDRDQCFRRQRRRRPFSMACLAINLSIYSDSQGQLKGTPESVADTEYLLVSVGLAVALLHLEEISVLLERSSLPPLTLSWHYCLAAARLACRLYTGLFHVGRRPAESILPREKLQALGRGLQITRGQRRQIP